jgi:hypothetical protein
MKNLIHTAVVTLFAASAAQGQAPQVVPVRSLVTDTAPRWNVASMKFVGNRLALGFIEEGSTGVVRFLEATASGWQFAATPLSSPSIECIDFGLSLAVDGTRLAVGSSSGHVFVIETASAVPTLVASWRASPAGYACVHSISGDSLLVGLPSSNGGQGGGALLQINGSDMVVTQTLVPERPAGRLGWSGGISGDAIVLSSEDYWGNWHAMTWRRQTSGSWGFEAELLPTNPAGNSIFGCASSIEGDVIAVGARDDSAAGPSSGACYVFERNGSQWVQAAKLTITEQPFGNQETGASVAVRGGRIWFSSAGSSENGIGDRGRLLVAEKIGGVWQVVQTLRSTETGNPTLWGYAPTFGPSGSVAAFGFDSPLPFTSWRLKCDVFAPAADCDQDGGHDLWQVWSGASADVNANGTPDSCEVPTCRDADLYANNHIDGADLGILLYEWGSVNPSTNADINNDGVVNGVDLGLLLAFWGPCPN